MHTANAQNVMAGLHVHCYEHVCLLLNPQDMATGRANWHVKSPVSMLATQARRVGGRLAWGSFNVS